MRLSIIAAVACLAAIGLSTAAESQAAVRKVTNIPAQALGPALQTLSRERNFQLVFRTDVVGDAQTQGAAGELSVDEALRQLLSGTGLTYRYLDAETITIAPLANRGVSSAAPASQQTGGDGRAPGGGHLAMAEGEQQNGRMQRGTEGHDKQAASSSTGEATSDQKDLQGALQDTLGEIVVTGTYIRGLMPRSSPLTVYDRDDIDRSGVATIEQLARQIPQNFPSADASTVTGANNAQGFGQSGTNNFSGAAFNLHGLGPQSTLTLLNGRRLAGGGGDGGLTDISMIPLSAIGRIEILADGASALYGADAIAGVVNLVLRTDFDGAETALRYGGATQGGADQFTGSQLFGKAWESGNAFLSYEHDKQDGLLAEDRDFIPVQPVPIHVLPFEERDSVFASGRQQLSDRDAVHAEAFFSQRDFLSDSALFTGLDFVVAQNDGRVRNYGGSAGYTRRLPGEWTLELGTDYSRIEQSFTSTFAGGTPSNLDDDSGLVGIDLRADGPLFELPSGSVKAALGTAFRKETFRDSLTAAIDPQAGTLERNVGSAFVELLVPVVGGADSTGQRLEMSLAARYDHYDDFGSSTNPKVGLVWSPLAGLNLRGSYGTSFQPPRLTQLISVPAYFTFQIPDPAGAGGVTDTLLVANSVGGRPTLEPQKSESFTLGFDFTTVDQPQFTLSASYFQIRFEDLISGPPIVAGNLFGIYSQTPALTPFIDRNPNLAEVTAIFTSPTFFGDFTVGPDGQPLGPAGVTAIFDQRPINLSFVESSGIDLAASYEAKTAYGQFDFNLSGTHLFKLNYEIIEGIPDVDLKNRIGNPLAWRVRGGMNWTRGALGASLAVNYANGYRNDFFTPEEHVASWTTTDLQLTYRTAEAAGHGSWFSAVTAMLRVQNAFDKDPPQVATPPSGGHWYGYDPTNASALGRIVTLELRKRW